MVTSTVVHYDSQVVVGHINNNYEVKGERMKKYLSMVKSKTGDGFSAKFIQIPRNENEQADYLAKFSSADYTDTTNNVLSFIQYAPTIDRLEVQVILPRTDWTTPITSYLRNGTLLEDHDTSCRLKVQSSCFIMIRDILYKRGFSRPYLRCLAPGEADYVMRKVNEGICGNHSGARSLVHKLVMLDTIGLLCKRMLSPM
ncbi:uncharacterized protein LOC142639660 [Castanea sativa]|uniref:uncharacterized protein LOC142639660 n=1 Tax=Castanea sativa TaxID=21020 RepID=UPI003F64E9BE